MGCFPGFLLGSDVSQRLGRERRMDSVQLNCGWLSMALEGCLSPSPCWMVHAAEAPKVDVVAVKMPCSNGGGTGPSDHETNNDSPLNSFILILIGDHQTSMRKALGGDSVVMPKGLVLE